MSMGNSLKGYFSNIRLFLTSISLFAGPVSDAKQSSAKSPFSIFLAICWCCAVVGSATVAAGTAAAAGVAEVGDSNIFDRESRPVSNNDQ